MPPRHHLKAVLPLVLATTATQASIVVLAPIVVDIGRSFHASVSAIGQGRTVLAGTAVLVSLVVGPMIDRVGVRPLIVWGSGLALAGAAATAASPTLILFYVGQAITGAGVACLLSAGFAGVRAFFEDEHTAWAMGYVVGAQSLAWIVGNPLIGILTEAVSWRLAYVVPAAAALAALLTALLIKPELKTNREAERDLPGLGLLAVLRDPSARRWTISELVAYSAWTADLTYVGAFYVKSYGVSEAAVGFLLATGSLCFLITSLSVNRITRRFNRRHVIVVGALGMGALVALILNVTPSVWFTVGVFCVMAIFAAVRTTGSSSLALDQMPERPGSMMAARTTAAQLGYTVGAVVGGAVLAVSDFGVLGFVLLAGMLMAAFLVARVHDPRPGPEAARLREPLPEPVPD
jgi:predicted MFS family arabinose efflux permease